MNRTPSYHSLPKEMVIEQGIDFYKLFRRMSMAENPYEEAKTFSWKYAENFYREKIPLHEAIYALMLMRRNLWLYAEFQGTFVTALEKTAGGGKSESEQYSVRLCILPGHRKISGVNSW